MEWKSFLLTLGEVDHSWKELRNDFPQYEAYLKKSELVITSQGVQYEFKKNMDVYDLQHYLPLLKKSAMKDGLAYLFDLLKKAIDEKAKNIDPKQESRLEKSIQAVRADIGHFPIECLELDDDFSVEIVCSTLMSDEIQAMKAHQLVNAEKTCQCKACIRVYLH